MERNMKKYLLSIIIPTKNRQFYCQKAILQVLGSVSNKVQIVIQDNSDNMTLQDFCNDLDKKQLKYNHHAGPLSFVDNFSEAVSLAEGEYLCMIGDDDGVLPIIENVAWYAKEKSLDAFLPGLNAVYCWPTSDPIIPNAENGYLYITPISFHAKKVCQESAMKSLLHKAFQDYQQTNIARIYHGIVHYSVLEKIKSKTGNYFGGLTPDMYMSVSLGLSCKAVEHANFPITISGICPGSGSSNSATGAHTGELKDAPHFIGHDGYSWNSIIPYFYTVETIWAETALHALEDMGAANLIKQFNLTYLLSVLLMKYPLFKHRIIAHAKTHKVKFSSIIICSIVVWVQRMINRGFKFITAYRLRSRRIYGIENIDSAELAINNIFSKFDYTCVFNEVGKM